MKIAVFSDVHGNLEALREVLADIGTKGVDTVCCAGDLVGYGPFPNEVVELLRGKGIPSVMGNYDEAIGKNQPVCGCEYRDEEAALTGTSAFQWSLAEVTAANKEYLKRLPFEVDIGTENHGLRIVHGSPRRINEYLYQDMEDKCLNSILFECTADVVICGHTHIPYVKRIGDKLLVNAGSVGRPLHGDPRAAYCIVEINATCMAEVHYVEYDFEVSARAVIETGLPHRLADIIRKGGL